jgi:hypothetical protein
MLEQWISEINSDPIFIGSSSDEREKEIQVNTYCISLTQAQINGLSVDNLSQYILELEDCRRKQFQKEPNKVGMIFYCWFDEMAAQLRIGTVSKFHSKLPFGCELRYVSLDQIVSSILNSQYHDGIPLTEFEEVEFDEEHSDDESEGFCLDIYTSEFAPIEPPV